MPAWLSGCLQVYSVRQHPPTFGQLQLCIQSNTHLLLGAAVDRLSGWRSYFEVSTMFVEVNESTREQ